MDGGLLDTTSLWSNLLLIPSAMLVLAWLVIFAATLAAAILPSYLTVRLLLKAVRRRHRPAAASNHPGPRPRRIKR